MQAFFRLVLTGVVLCAIPVPFARAQEVVPDTVTLIKAQVVEIISEGTREIPGTQTSTKYQIIKVKLLEGEEKGQLITIENDYLLLKKDQIAYIRHTTNSLDGRDQYTVADPYRIPTLVFFGALFLLCLFVFGGKQGIRGLLALIASLFFITYLLLPGLLAGYSPMVISIGVASIIIIAGSYITHGFTRTTTAAVVGMLIAICITGILSYVAIYSAQFSGYSNEESVYLNFNTHGSLDLVGLLLGSLLIGFLGVLYDAAISQAIAVEELLSVGKHLTRREIYSRALRIGREHIGALVNILAIAYVGASLPLLLLLKLTSTGSLVTTLNQELFAMEILRTLVGSIGLILAVPITSLVAVYMLSEYKRTPPENQQGHTHHH